MAVPQLKEGEFNAFRDYLQSVCGILLGENKEYLVVSRLRSVMTEKKLDGMSALLSEMKRDNRLRETVVDAMTTNETLWFRDNHPFRILRERLLPEFAEKRKPLNIWCAASSTGQEPYSISIEIEEFKRKKPGGLTGEKIVATDISPTALEIAKKGQYEKIHLSRGMPQEFLTRYFEEVEPGRWKAKKDITGKVDFRTLNLLNSFASLGKFDIVYCRNVLIYFSTELKTDILTRIHGTLKPGGYLFLGASESLNGLNDHYEMVQCNPGLIYQAK